MLHSGCLWDVCEKDYGAIATINDVGGIHCTLCFAHSPSAHLVICALPAGTEIAATGAKYQYTSLRQVKQCHCDEAHPDR